MDFNHTETRAMLADSLNRFLADHYGAEQRNVIIASSNGISEEIWQQLAELGILGALFSEEEGGFGGDGFDIAVVFESLGRALVVEPVLQSAILCGRLLVALGNDEQKVLVEQLIAGQARLALAHTEEDNHYDLDIVDCDAVKVEDGYQLTGHKTVVMHGGSADQLIVSAKLESGDLALFLVPKDNDGLTLRSDRKSVV